LEKPRNILIIQTAFIGDAILASSLVEKLHAHFPKAQLSILVRAGNESIYHSHPFLKEILVWNKRSKKIRNLFSLISRIRKNKYDYVVNCHRFASSGMMAAFSGAKHIAGYKENPFSFLFNYTVRHRIGDGTHEIERYNQLVEDFTDANVFHPKLYPSATDAEEVKKFQSASYVCMAPASVWFTKQLPVEKWVELCNSVNSFTRIYLLGAPGDTDLCAQIKARSEHDDIRVVAGKLSLLQSARLMQFAAMNYVNDSAPLHLASSVNAPVTAFFCSTVPEFGFGPLSDSSKVQQVPGLQCKPCGLHGYRECPLGHFKCGHAMNIEIAS
jgi:ADP-heptose:LPS heptosyltransferase